MIDLFNHAGVRVFISSLNTDINWATISTWLVIAVILSMVGGALGGMMIAGKDLGFKFAAIIGSLFAPAGVIPTLILGLLLLNFLGNY